MDEKTKALNEAERAELEAFRAIAWRYTKEMNNIDLSLAMPIDQYQALTQAQLMQNSAIVLHSPWGLQNASPFADRSSSIGEWQRVEYERPLSFPRLILKYTKWGFLGALGGVLAAYLFLELATILGWM